MTRSNMLRAMAIAAAMLSLSAHTSSAQPGGPGWGPGMMGPGMMMGPGFLGARGWDAMCSPRAAGLAEWRVEQIERSVRPTEAQRAALNDLKTVSVKAAETIAAACPHDFPETSIGRLSVMEQRLEAMLGAIKTVRPSFEAFYAVLSDDQKARLDASGPRRWGWRNWHWGDR